MKAREEVFWNSLTYISLDITLNTRVEVVDLPRSGRAQHLPLLELRQERCKATRILTPVYVVLVRLYND